MEGGVTSEFISFLNKQFPSVCVFHASPILRRLSRLHYKPFLLPVPPAVSSPRPPVLLAAAEAEQRRRQGSQGRARAGGCSRSCLLALQTVEIFPFRKLPSSLARFPQWQQARAGPGRTVPGAEGPKVARCRVPPGSRIL